MRESSLNDDWSFILGLTISFTCLFLCNQFLICFMRLGFQVRVFIRLLFESTITSGLLLMPVWACCTEEETEFFFFQPPHWGDVWGWQDFPYLRAKARALTYVWVKNTHSSVSGGSVLAERNKCMEEFVHVCVFTVLMGCCQDLGLGVPSDIHNIIIQQLAASWISLLICFFMQFLFISGISFFYCKLTSVGVLWWMF